jgi:hypothetical protein
MKVTLKLSVSPTDEEILEPIYGNPVLESKDGTTRATLETVLAPSWTAEDRAAYGIYVIEVEPIMPRERVEVSYQLVDGVPVEIRTQLPPTTTDVDIERDRRINDGMTWNEVRYQTKPADRENVHGAATMALAAMTMGAQPGDLFWHGGVQPFVWIAEDNSLNTFDAQTFFAFAQAMARHKSANIFMARALKDMDPIPTNYKDGIWWGENIDPDN